MPLISTFYGLLIYMYFLDTKEHKLPHIHAHYQGSEASFAIETAELLSGKLPPKQVRLVQAWIELRKDELLADWTLASTGQGVERIEPLK